MDQIQTWITTIFQDSQADTSNVTSLVQFVITNFSQAQLQTFATEFTQIADITKETFGPAQVVELTTAIKNIVGQVYPILEELKTNLASSDVNFIKNNLKVFIQVLILVVLYNIQDKVNIQAITPYLSTLSELAAMGVNLETNPNTSKFLSMFSCCTKQ
jgi:hypothetical protein